MPKVGSENEIRSFMSENPAGVDQRGGRGLEVGKDVVCWNQWV